MGALSGHPNIVNILQVGVTESSRPFIVMPYHARGSLAERLRREGRIAWPEALRIGVKLCGALETAHRTDTLHRDIKPANVLVNSYGEPQLSDFGTARIAGGYKTMTGFFTGTLSYTAPEVLAGNPPTVAADVYSLAATIYALIAGSPPHERKADEDLIAHYLRITSTPVPDLRPEGIPADVCAAIEKAMSKEFGRPAAVGGGVRSRVAVGAAAQRVDTRIRWRSVSPVASPEQTGGTQRAVPDAVHLPSAPPRRRQPVRQPFTSPPSGPGDVRAHLVGQRVEPAVASRHRRRRVPASAPVPVRPIPGSTTPSPETPKKDRKRILIVAGAALAGVLLVLGGILIVTSSRDKGGGEAAPPSRPTAEPQPVWEPIADARVARDGGGGHPGRRHHLDFRRHGGGRPSQRGPRGLRPRHRQLEGRRGPARSGAACDVGDVAGHPGRARRLAHRRHQSEGCDGPGVEGRQQSLDGVAASDAASGGGRSRRGG